MRKLRLNREDSTDIGFATSCLTASVLTFEEFKDWLNEIICATDDYPHYIFDILDLEKKFDLATVSLTPLRRSISAGSCTGCSRW